MQHATFTTARSRLMPLAALLLAAALGGCVGYSSYPSRDYSYSYPGSYYAGYPQNYGSILWLPPLLFSQLRRYNGSYETGGAGEQ